MPGSQDLVRDPRNANAHIYLNGELVLLPRRSHDCLRLP